MGLFFKKSKKKRVSGSLIRFDQTMEGHIPVFSFETEEGRRIESPVKDLLSLEEMLTDDGVREFLEIPLPIGGIDITYREDEPEDFSAAYL